MGAARGRTARLARRLLRPGQRLMRRLPVSGKFAVIAVAILVPLVATLAVQALSVREERAAAARAREGLAHLGPVVELRLATEQARSDLTVAGAAPRPSRLLLREVDAVEARYGGGSGWPAVRSAVLRAEPGQDRGAPQRREAYDEALDALDAHAARVADRSGLSLLGDLPTHLLVEGMLLDDLPSALEAARDLQDSALDDRPGAEDGPRLDRRGLEDAADRLAERTAALRTSLGPAALPVGSADGLYAALDGLHQRAQGVLHTVDPLDAVVSARQDLGVDGVVDEADALTMAGLAELDRRLADRAAALDRTLALQLGGTLLALAAAAYLFLSMFRATSQDLARVLADLEAVAVDAPGPRPVLRGRDELADLSRGVARTRRRIALLLAELQRQGARFRTLVQSSTDLTLVTTREGVVTYVSPAVGPLLGADAGAWLGSDVLGHVVDADRPRVRAALAALPRAAQGDRTVEWRVVRDDGAVRVLESTCRDLTADPSVGGVVWNTRDISDRHALQERLAHQAFHDPLTRLPNRLLFADRLEQALLRRGAAGPTVLLLDLDGFKDVNDSLGHAAGDQVIVEVARRLVACARSGDTVARLGGDEFAVLLEDVHDEATALALAGRVLAALQDPCVVAGLTLALRASVGVATADEDVRAADDLVRNADVTMYAAKRAGKGRVARFEATMRDSASERLDLSATLTGVVHRGELELHYQPIADAAAGRWYAVEALLRWRRPGRGLVPPCAFVPVAEETGAIVDIGRWVLATACRDLARLRRASPALADLRVSVNLSVRQLHDPRIVDDVARALGAAGLPAAALVVEITESGLVEETGLVLERIAAVRGLGVAVAVDDFGSGYSALGYLRRLPVDVLKVDRSFVAPLRADDEAAVALARSIVAMGDALGLRTVAEGVETLEQAELLTSMGCPHLQGYLLARPLPVRECEPVLRSGVPLAGRRPGAVRDA
ncbi:EAL domain-containing protein [Vallicoccus soli]|uniref:EAL domain-containing protein n=1 Tax=Vallicoccus soli TaxID=2339232 RepID=UPI00140210A6|nr:EAL domain-containing protein [Vallicoccus soli]